MALYKKGQYFSFDAIVASIIFALAISILSTHWFALRAQIDDHDTYLEQEAYRISDILLGAGEPSNWYVNPVGAKRAGLATEPGNPNMLNRTTLLDLDGFQFSAPSPALSCSDPIGRYSRMQSLLSTGSNFWVEVNLSARSADNSMVTPTPVNFWFGCAPSDTAHAQLVKVRRIVSIRQDPSPSTAPTRYYWGNLTVYMWDKKKGN